MSAASPQVKTMAPQVKKPYCGFSPGLPRVILPMSEKEIQREITSVPRPMIR